MIRTLTFAIFLILSFIYVQGQKTPNELGETVFQVFEKRDSISLDTLTANCLELKAVYLAIDSTSELVKKTNFCDKIAYHHNRFIEKCTSYMSDSNYYNINWEDIEKLKIEYSFKETPTLPGTPKDVTTIKRHYLNIIFISNNQKYSLAFKGIKLCKDIWKLGDDVRIRKID